MPLSSYSLDSGLYIVFSIAFLIDSPEVAGADKSPMIFSPAVEGIINEVCLMAKTPPGMGKVLTINVNKNERTIFSNSANRPSLSGMIMKSISDQLDFSFLKNDRFTVDVDISSSGTAVANVTVLVRGKQRLQRD